MTSSIVHTLASCSTHLWVCASNYRIDLTWPSDFLRHFYNSFPDDLFCDLNHSLLTDDTMEGSENVGRDTSHYRRLLTNDSSYRVSRSQSGLLLHRQTAA